MQEKPWLASYESGVPSQIEIGAYQNMNALFAEISVQFSQYQAFANFGKSISYAELASYSDYFAGFLQHYCKVSKGDRVAIMLPNLLHYPITMMGALKVGCVVTSINPLYTAYELKHQLCDSGAKVIIVLENFARTLAEILPETQVQHTVVATIGDMLPWPKSSMVNFVIRKIKKMVPEWRIDNYISYSQAIDFGKKTNVMPVNLSCQDLAFLQYTGGTTGRAKGAMLSHGNMLANIAQSRAWLKQIITPGKEIIVTALPLYHIFSLTANCLTFMSFGALNLLITNPRDFNGFIRQIKKSGFSIITGVNTLFNALLNHPKFKQVDFSKLKVALGGGMSVHRTIAERWQKLTGSRLLEAYGLTETSPAVCMNPMNLQAFNGTVGLPIPSTEVSVRDDDGQELGLYQPGELWVRGPQVMQGYWQQEAETKLVLTEDGWLKTGDIATLNSEGYVTIVDRKKDVILVSGFNVYPTEVEDVITQLPEISEVAVIGVPDQAKGESVRAYVVCKAAIKVSDIIAHCRKILTAYKIPKSIEFCEQLPKSNVGKILRRQLRDQLISQSNVKL